MYSGAEVAAIRKGIGWSQQQLAIQSGVNKAYVSEYESGIRPALPPEMLERITNALLTPPAGRTSPVIRRREGRLRLVLRDPDGNEIMPRVAAVHWTEEDGTRYKMYLGEGPTD